MSTTILNAIVLKNIEYNEAKIVTVFSKELGKLSFYAAGVNKPTSKNKYSIQTFNESQFEVFKSRNDNKLSKLKTGNLINENSNISKNYNYYLYASVISQYIDKVFENREKSFKAFSMLCFAIKQINNFINPFQTYVMFLYYSLIFSGNNLELNKCVRCDLKKSIYKRYDYKLKGLICKGCMVFGENIQPISFIDTLIKMNEKNYYEIMKTELQIIDLIVIHNILYEFLNNEVGIYLNGMEELKKGAGFKIPTHLEDKYL